jgi:thiamine pyrophosphate-dependent acetolactate synthase large subunit-like protein
MVLKPTVSDILIDILADAGVRHVFGIPGDAINAFVEAIRRQDRVRFIQVRHEETGAMAASAQAKLTGELAACVGTAGPGAIHLLNGLYDAKLDHAPVLAITGKVETQYVGTDYHQEVDLFTLFKDVAAFNEVVMNVNQMPQLAEQAIRTAIAERSVSHLSLPLDIAGGRVGGSRHRQPPYRNDALISPCEDDLDRAARVLNGASRVAILAGIGAAGARSELLALAERLRAPIIKTLRAKDLLPDEHPYVVGGLGLLGTRPAVDVIEECDALLLVGTDFPYHDFYPKDVPAVQIDVEPSRLGKRYPIEVGLAGHAHLALTGLTKRVHEKDREDFLASAQKRMASWFAEMDEIERSDDEPMHPQRLARAVGDLADDDAIFACDTGAVTVWGARNLRIRDGQKFVLSSSLASMAFAMPAAIGAQLAYPGRQVIALAGDGGLGMLLGDFVTAVKYELPITVVVFNNHKLGLIQMEQEVQGYPEFQTELHNPDFAAVARASGGEGIRVTDPADLDGALRTAFSTSRPYIVDVLVNPEERTMPPRIEMWQALGYGVAKVKEFVSRE